MKMKHQKPVIPNPISQKISRLCSGKFRPAYCKARVTELRKILKKYRWPNRPQANFKKEKQS